MRVPRVAQILVRQLRAAVLNGSARSVAVCGLVLVGVLCARDVWRAAAGSALNVLPVSLTQTSTQIPTRHTSVRLTSATSALAPALAFDVNANAVATVSAASFEAAPVAPESIVASFGVNLATRSASATAVPLPTSLAGTTVEVNGVRAGLFFVSSGQVNFQIPAETLPGTATVTVRSGDGTVTSGTVQIAYVAPGVFAANGNGRGVPAALVLRVRGNGTQSFELLSQFDSASNSFIPKPIDLGPATEQVFLVLYATGLRYLDTPRANYVNVLIGGEQVTPSFVGPIGGLAGVDQINVLLPRTLSGRQVNVSVSATDYSSSNLALIQIAGSVSGPVAPQISGFVPQEPVDDKAVAGRRLLINGTGFSTDKTANRVYIGPSLTEAQVMAATPTQLEVIVPFGVETGTVKVTTPTGEGVSASVVSIVTSISGVVENTNRQPLAGVNVSLSDGVTSTTTSADGTFVLAKVQPGPQSVFVDGDAIPTQPPYPKLTTKIVVTANRDNKFTSAIALQQATGSSSTIGSNSTPQADSGVAVRTTSTSQQQQPTPQPPTINIQTGNFSLQVTANAKPQFPDGSTAGKIYLTPVLNSRTPVELPAGVYSSSIVQITPFDTKIPEGAKLIFPNDGRPPNTNLRLYRYDSTTGKFVEVEDAKVTVSSDGKQFETGANDVKVASIYLASTPAQNTAKATTTVQGKVLCCVDEKGQVVGGRTTPVGKANIKARGQETETDDDGAYILRNVPAANGENLSVDVSYRQPSGRVARAESPDARVVAGGVTLVGPTYLPSDSINRPPVILGPPKVEIPVGDTTDVGFVIYDPDPGQQVNVMLSSNPNVSWATLRKVQGAGGVVNANAYQLTLTPPARGNFSFTISADDKQQPPGTAVFNLSVSVTDQNRPPVANSLDLSTDEDTPLAIRLTGTDPDNNPLTYRIVTPPLNGGLSGTAPNLTYVPIPNFNGTDIFTFVVNDGSVNSQPATVKITVKPVNDAPVLSVPTTANGSEGQLLVVNLAATDVDQGQTLTFTGSNLPNGATLVTTSPTTAQLRWTPSFTQAGNYTVTIRVADNGTPPLSDSKDIKITIADVTTLSVPGPQTINEGQPLAFDVAVPGGGGTVTTGTLPDGATVTPNGTGVWQFKWTPGFTQAGNYTVTFRATVNGTTDSKDVRITVLDAQHDFGKDPADFTIYGQNGPVPRNNLDGGDAVGTSLATGDLNGDGIPDLVVGAPFANNGTQDVGRDTGAVYVFFGKASLAGTLDLAQQKPDVTLYGERAYDAFGTSVTIGDLNGDGKLDLSIGAPLADTTALRDCGKVYVLNGPFPIAGLDANRAAVITQVTTLTIIGGKAGDRLGASVASGLVRSKTGAWDLLAGAPGVDMKLEDFNVNDAGAVYLFAGGVALSKDIDLAKTSATFTLTAEPLLGSGQLGSSLAVGNFNGDDYADFTAGAPFANGFNRSVGFAYLIMGSATLTGTKSASSLGVTSLFGDNENDNFGTSVALGDINGDGFADWIIGLSGGDGPNNSRANTGEVLVFYGTAGVGAKSSLIYGGGRAGDTFPDAFGTSLATGDFNGDGIADLIVGAPGADSVSDKRDPQGAAYLFFGTRAGLPSTYDLLTKTADLTIFGAFAGDRLGAGAFAFGKLNGADVPALVLGIPRSASVSNGRLDAGEVRVLFGVRR